MERNLGTFPPFPVRHPVRSPCIERLHMQASVLGADVKVEKKYAKKKSSKRTSKQKGAMLFKMYAAKDPKNVKTKKGL